MNKIRVFDYLIYFTIIVNIVLLVLLLNGRKGNQHFEDVITRLNLKTEQVKSFQEMVILQMLNDGVEQPLKSELIDIYNNKIKLNDLHNGDIWIMKIFKNNCFTCFENQIKIIENHVIKYGLHFIIIIDIGNHIELRRYAKNNGLINKLFGYNPLYEFNDIDNYQLPCIKLDEKGNAVMAPQKFGHDY